MIPELSHDLMTIAAQLQGRADTGCVVLATEAGAFARALHRLAEATRVPPVPPPGGPVIAPETLRAWAVRMQVIAALTGCGKAPEPEVMRMVGIQLFDAADCIEDLRGMVIRASGCGRAA